MRIARLCVWSIVLIGCQQPATSKQDSVSAPAKAEPAAPAKLDSGHFDSPRAVYKQYADALNASRWADAIAVFTQKGKTGLVLANFKALALLAAKEHPKQDAYKAVLHDFCQAHSLRCAEERWNGLFARTLLAEGNVTNLLSDVSALAAAQPEATYVELMKLLQGVDANAVVPLDPTLSHVIYLKNSVSGEVKRSDGQTYTMWFESSPERGWLIVE